MANNVVHFAIHADDLERARRFYEQVFGWRFEAWGPAGFYRVSTGSEHDPGIDGALHERHVPVSGGGMTCYECTVSVDSITETAALITRHGGTIIMPESEIPGVGRHIGFSDTEGNTVAAMQYEVQLSDGGAASD
ncbi:MAG: VOC family protein [Dehalococcoidia bacterium]|nr:VOC family protein [Dehalococcoidia bacterium]